MRLPRFIKVGSSKYKVTRDPEWVPEEEGEVFGLTCHETNVVYVAPGMSADRTADTSLHESLHVMMYKAGIHLTEKQEEQFIVQLTPVLLDFIRDNVSFINYLINHSD